MAQNLPIRFQELLQLTALGVNPAAISFASVTLESDKYVCIRETVNDKATVAIVDMAQPQNLNRRTITADAAIMNPSSNILALKSGNQLQVFNMDTKAKLKATQMDDQIVFWRWLNDDVVALVTGTSVFHWSLSGPEQPVKMFERHANLASCQIISYKTDAALKWLALVGIYQKDNKVAGAFQLHSVEKNVSQALEGHAAAFAQIKLEGKDATLFAFTKRTATESKLYIIEVPLESSRLKRSVELYFPPEADADFPVAMQITEKYNIVFVVTKFGFLHMFDLESGTLIFRNRISSDTIFVTTLHRPTGGVMGIDRKGRVLLVTVDDNNIVPFITNQLNNYELAIKLASKAGLGGADDLFTSQFTRLFQGGQYAAAAKVAAESPRGILRTPKTMQMFQQIPVQPGQTAPLLQYFGVLLESGKLNKQESVELARIVLQQQRKQLLENWLQEDKLECSEELGDLVKPYDPKLALGVYFKANAHPKVLVTLAETGQYDKIVPYAQKVGYQAEWKFLLNQLLNVNPEAASSLAQNLVNNKLMDVNVAVDMFTARGPQFVPATTSPARRPQGQPPRGGPAPDQAARDQPHPPSEGGRCHSRQRDVLPLRPPAHRWPRREGRPPAARPRALHRHQRHQARHGQPEPSHQSRVAHRLLCPPGRRGLPRVPQAPPAPQLAPKFAARYQHLPKVCGTAAAGPRHRHV
jgi:clathrin heavy chain